jgi:hypothetical protein
MSTGRDTPRRPSFVQAARNCRAPQACAEPNCLCPATPQPRFFMDHGMIHDRVSGQHIHTDQDIEPGATERLFALLNELHSARSEIEPTDAYKEAVAQNLKLRKALEQCVSVAKAWHGDDDFDLYFNHSPEMKLIRDVLGKMPEEA